MHVLDHHLRAIKCAAGEFAHHGEVVHVDAVDVDALDKLESRGCRRGECKSTKGVQE